MNFFLRYFTIAYTVKQWQTVYIGRDLHLSDTKFVEFYQ